MRRNEASRSPGAVESFMSGVVAAIDGDDAAEEPSSISMRLRANGFGNGRVVERRASLRCPPRSRAYERHRRVQVLIVEQREERHLRRVVCLDAGARGRESRIRLVADAHARFDVGRRGAVDDELGAAVIDVVERREHRDARRLEPDLDVARRLRVSLAEAVQHGPRGADDDPRGARLQLGHVALADRPHDVDAVGRFLADVAPVRAGRV